MTRRRTKCLVAFCNRSEVFPICGRHWRLVPVEARLALDEAADLWKGPDKELRPFYAWAYWETMRQAASLAYFAERDLEEERLAALAAQRRLLADPVEQTRATLTARRRRREGLARGPP